MTWWSALLGLIGTVVVAVGGYWTAKSSGKASPYDALAGRVVALEKADADKGEELSRQAKELRNQACQIDTLRQTEGLLVRWLRRIRHGVEGGTIPPWPIDPEWLSELEKRYEDSQDPTT